MFSYTPAPTSRQAVPNHPSVVEKEEKVQQQQQHQEGDNNEKKGNNKVGLEDLFNFGRIKEKAPLWHKILFLFYLPFGFVLCTVRVALFLMLCISFLLLPRSIGDHINMPFLKFICGLYVRHNNNRGKPVLNEPYIIAGNHVADFDTFAMWMVFPKYHTLTAAHLKTIPLIGTVYAKFNAIFVTPTPEGRAQVKERVNEVLTNDPAPVLIFPEGGLTNGKAGTMMYHRYVFSLDFPIVPLAIALNDPWPVHHDYLGSTWTRNFLWFLFVPFHIFDITLLAPQRRNGGETPEQFAHRVQVLTCEYLNIHATNFSYSQKKELAKKISSPDYKKRV